jgi:hypothetical protein
MRHTVIVESGRESGYVVVCPSLPLQVAGVTPEAFEERL